MTRRKLPRPGALAVLCVLAMAYGLYSLAKVLLKLPSVVSLDLGLLGIPAAVGLWHFSRGWRTFTLAMLWLSFIITPLSIWMTCASTGNPTGKLSVVIWLVSQGLVFLWMYRVLTRPEVRARFYLSLDTTADSPIDN